LFGRRIRTGKDDVVNHKDSLNNRPVRSLKHLQEWPAGRG